jgi:hypothetical protein
MNLHPSIQAYFDADKRNESGAPLRAFAANAIVEDDGHSHAGHEAIDAWWRDAKARYQAVAEPLEMHETGGAVRVRAKVTGQFSGSPITLNFTFQIEDQQIAALRIGA